jgi:hypothetical protein
MVDADAALGHHLLELAVADGILGTAHSTISPSKCRPLNSFIDPPLLARPRAVSQRRRGCNRAADRAS